ncbi:MAG: hypothetical protein JEY99_14620 [Spirochaetales bacterium]|nr:hypothetical protein [Spirochaetales bacterium]
MRIRHLLYLTITLFFTYFSLSAQVINFPGLVRSEFSSETLRLISTIHEEGWSDAGFEYSRISEFSRGGVVESETFYDENGKEGSKILYFYDDAGRLSLKEFHHPDARIPDSEYYVWDNQGRLFSVARVYTTGKYGWRFEYTYDEFNRLSVVTKIDRYWKDVVVWVKKFSYDEAGRVVSAEGGGLDENIRWYDEFEWDSENRLAVKKKFDVNKELVSITRFGYSNDGRVDLEEYFDVSGDRLREVNFYYRENERGLWIEKQIGEMIPGRVGNYFRPVSRYIRNYTYRESLPEAEANIDFETNIEDTVDSEDSIETQTPVGVTNGGNGNIDIDSDPESNSASETTPF